MHQILDIPKLMELINNGESEIVEFKESFNDEALETLGAFVNAIGGTLLLGVKDSGAVCGFDIGKKTLEDIANRIQEATEPRIQPSILTINHEGKKIIVITVSAGIGAPVSVRGRYFRRVGKTNQRMSHEEIMQRIVANSKLSWDAVVETNSSLADLDVDNINDFVEMVRREGRHPIPKNVSNLDFLRKIELVIGDQPTRAGILLLGNNPERYFGSAFLKLGRFRSPILIVDDREMHGSLINQLDGTMGWFRERLETAFIITGNPQREVIWEYPLDAIREAVINLLSHRDYISGAHSQIRLYDERLEFWNAGSLPNGLTTEMLFIEHKSIPRNKKIAEAFFYMGLIERWGSGTIRIAKELQKYNHPVPQFKSESGTFRLYFYRATPVHENTLVHEKILTKPFPNLTERQLIAVNYVEKYGSITNSQYQEIAQITKRTATRELKKLKDVHVFIQEGITGHGTKYKLKH